MSRARPRRRNKLCPQVVRQLSGGAIGFLRRVAWNGRLWRPEGRRKLKLAPLSATPGLRARCWYQRLEPSLGCLQDTVQSVEFTVAIEPIHTEIQYGRIGVGYGFWNGELAFLRCADDAIALFVIGRFGSPQIPVS